MAERDAQGRFTKGNPGGPGNPLAAKVHAYRAACFDAIGPEHLAGILRKLTAMALQGDVAAAKVVLERCLGRVIEHDLLERLEALEHTLNERGEH